MSELETVIDEFPAGLDDRSAKFVAILRDSGVLGDADWSRVLEMLRDALGFLADADEVSTYDRQGHLMIDIDEDPRDADWIKSASANRLAGHQLPSWASIWLWRVGNDREPAFWSKVGAAAKDFGCEAASRRAN